MGTPCRDTGITFPTCPLPPKDLLPKTHLCTSPNQMKRFHLALGRTLWMWDVSPCSPTPALGKQRASPPVPTFQPDLDQFPPLWPQRGISKIWPQTELSSWRRGGIKLQMSHCSLPIIHRTSGETGPDWESSSSWCSAHRADSWEMLPKINPVCLQG